MMAATAPAAATALSSPFPGRTSKPLRALLPVARVSPHSPAITSFLGFGCSSAAGRSHLHAARKTRCWPRRSAPFTARASAAEGTPGTSERWLLEPVGDGDCKHIGFRVPMPSAFELASTVVTVGRLPDKADMVIPVATVSSVHARLEKKDGALLVTDLDSTNGTFVDDKKLRPGAAATVSPGSCITFGDTHLAIFRVSKLQVEDPAGTPADSKIDTETEQVDDDFQGPAVSAFAIAHVLILFEERVQSKLVHDDLDIISRANLFTCTNEPFLKGTNQPLARLALLEVYIVNCSLDIMGRCLWRELLDAGGCRPHCLHNKMLEFYQALHHTAEQE